ncbi:MAG: oligopeptide:H+ symporter [Chthoniobacterales bacterium]|nr:oligopeptide:H+ symporter [Chthoniobacterales bacterium]
MELSLKQQQKKASLFIIAVIMWEFFSFYGLKAILVLYFTSQLHFSDAAAYQLFGSFISLVFITPILGGWLADRFCGYRYATAVGCVLIVLGHLMLTAFGNNVYIGLSLLTMGIGFFKSNAVCLISNCYPNDPVAATAAFSWYYVSGNLGSAAAATICPYLVENINWEIGFIMAAFGMMIGFIVLLLSVPYFSWEKKTKKTERWAALPLLQKAIITGGILLSAFLFFYFMLRYDLIGYLLIVAGIIALIICAQIYKQADLVRKKRLLIMALLTAFVTSFWIFSNQVSSSFPLFILRYVNRTTLGCTFPTGMFQALNPISILVGGAVMAFLWRWMGRRGIRPQPDVKVSVALVLLVLGFLSITHATTLANTQHAASMFFPVLSIVLLGMAELFTEPVLLAAWGDASPHDTEGRLVAIYFLCIGAIGNYLSIWVSKLTVDPTTSKATAATYHSAYLQATYIAIVLFSLLIARILWRKWKERHSSNG